MLMLGLGVGVQMQSLILAVRGASTTAILGTATSGVSLYSANGGSLGVALLGTIFNHRFATEIVHLPPAGSPIPSLAEIGGLPPSLASRDPRAA